MNTQKTFEAKVSFTMFDEKELSALCRKMKRQQGNASSRSFRQLVSPTEGLIDHVAKEKIRAAKVPKVQRNSEHMVEIEISVCSAFFQRATHEEQLCWVKDTKRWLYNEFGDQLLQLDLQKVKWDNTPCLKAYVVPLKLKTVNLRRNKKEIAEKSVKTDDRLCLCAHEMFSSVERRKMVERYNQVLARYNLECATHSPAKRVSKNEIQEITDRTEYQCYVLNEAVKLLASIKTKNAQEFANSSPDVALLQQFQRELKMNQQSITNPVERLV